MATNTLFHPRLCFAVLSFSLYACFLWELQEGLDHFSPAPTVF